MLRWLERNGYDVSYFTGVDSDLRGELIQQHALFLSVGHDEYWSADQRAKVEAARDAGVHLAFFSGNEVFWKTRWEPSIDGSGTSHRTLVTYKETHANQKIDPLPDVWTGTWRDIRGFNPEGPQPENALTGTIFTVNCCTYAIEVPAPQGRLRFWRDTDFATLTPGQVGTLPTGTLGYEWDEDLDNGARPPGLLRLSRTTVNVPERILDQGSNYGPGTATHSLTLYRHPSGALVFGAGTVQWSWGLDDFHDRGSMPIDRRMQQATVNLFADMGVQPASLQEDLVPASSSQDTTPPQSVALSPADGSSIPVGAATQVVGQAVDVDGRVAAVEVSLDEGASWHPAEGLEDWVFHVTPSAAGTIRILSRAADDSGNIGLTSAPLVLQAETDADTVHHVFAENETPANPTVTDNLPIEVGVKFFADVPGEIRGVRFFKGSGNTGTHIGHLWSIDGTLLAEAEFTGESAVGWQEVRFPQPVPIQANTLYVASYHSSNGFFAIDTGFFSNKGIDRPPLHLPAAGGSVGPNGVFRYGPSGFPTDGNTANYWVDVVFAQQSGDDTIPPTILSVSPVEGAVGVPVESSVSVRFSEPIDPATLDSARVTLTGLVPGSTHFFRVSSTDAAGNTASSAIQSFENPLGVLVDTTVVDFQAGDLSGTTVTMAGDGEVMLTPLLGSDFSGTVLPTGWSESPWAAGGAATVAAGRLTVDATLAATDAFFGPGRAIEAVVTFGAAAFQHIGFGENLADPDQAWAMFSTNTGTNTLFARTNTGTSVSDTPIPGAWLGAPHRYRIEWHADRVLFLIDGALVHTAQVALGTPMRPVFSDLNLGGPALEVDWVRMSPFRAEGSFLSRVFDGGEVRSWLHLAFTTEIPPGGDLSPEFRTGDTPTPDGSWTGFQPVPSSGAPLAAASRYIQYRAHFLTSDPNDSPRLQDVAIAYGSAAPPVNQPPVAADDAYATDRDVQLVVGAPGVLGNDSDPDGDALQAALVSGPFNGTLNLQADGSFTHQPNPGFTGNDAFTYQASDGQLASTATVSLTVQAASGLLIAIDDVFHMNTWKQLNQKKPGVLGNDSSSDGRPLRARLITPTAFGDLELNEDGTFLFTPTTSFTVDAFQYEAVDSLGRRSAATVTIHLGSNMPPEVLEKLIAKEKEKREKKGKGN